MTFIDSLRNIIRWGITDSHKEFNGEYNHDDNDCRIPIDDNAVLGITTVWSCVSIISEVIASLPIALYDKSSGSRAKVTNLAEARILRTPNDQQTLFVVLQTMMAHALLRGNGYLKIVRDNKMNPTKLKFLPSLNVTPVYDANSDTLFYCVFENGIWNNYYAHDIIHVMNMSYDSYKGKSVIRTHADTFEDSLIVNKYGKQFFKNGINPSVAFKYPGTLTDESYKRLFNDLKKKYSGIANAHSPLLLEGGLSVEKLSIPPEDAQFIATRKFSKIDIATIFKVPLHLVNDLEKSSYSSNEQMSLDFVKNCLTPWIVKIEQEFNTKLLKEVDQDNMYYKFNLKGLLRGDAVSRSNYYRTMLASGVMTPNEVRELEDMDAYDNGNHHMVQVNMDTVDHIVNKKTVE